MVCKTVSLKPFMKEKDSDRYYDILRSILIAKKLADRGNITDVQRKKSVSLYRKKIKEIVFLKKSIRLFRARLLLKLLVKMKFSSCFGPNRILYQNLNMLHKLEIMDLLLILKYQDMRLLTKFRTEISQCYLKLIVIRFIIP